MFFGYISQSSACDFASQSVYPLKCSLYCFSNDLPFICCDSAMAVKGTAFVSA